MEGATQGSLFGESNTAAPKADRTVSTKLAGLAERARKEARLTNVVHYVDEELLRLASLRKQVAPGVDGQRYEDYAANLDRNLKDLYARLKSGRYPAPVIRRVYIPKRNIPLTLPQRFAPAYRAAGGSARVEWFPGQSHGFARQPGPAATRAVEIITDFVAAHTDGRQR
jgi:hypothetical protein